MHFSRLPFTLLVGLLAACGAKERFDFTRSNDGKIVYRHDRQTGQTWVSRLGRDWVELEEPDARIAKEQRAAEEQRRRSQVVEDLNRKHPERLRQFARYDHVTVLAGDPRQTLRGRQGSVREGPIRTTDPDSGVVWKLTYEVAFDGLGSNEVDAENLALVGSKEEAADLSVALPEQWAAIVARRSADKRKEDEARARVRARDANPRVAQAFEILDPVVVLDSDPRPTLRGRCGLVYGQRDQERVLVDGKWEVVRRSYEVTFIDFPSPTVVDAEHLEHQTR